MPSATIDPNLAEEIRRVQAEGDPHRRIPALIELSEPLEVPPGAQMAELERRARERQAGVVEHLSRLGVSSGVQRSTLANAVSVALTPEEIAEIARRDDVRVIRLDRAEQVTT
jgi:hypothetical protein